MLGTVFKMRCQSCEATTQGYTHTSYGGNSALQTKLSSPRINGCVDTPTTSCLELKTRGGNYMMLLKDGGVQHTCTKNKDVIL